MFTRTTAKTMRMTKYSSPPLLKILPKASYLPRSASRTKELYYLRDKLDACRHAAPFGLRFQHASLVGTALRALSAFSLRMAWPIAKNPSPGRSGLALEAAPRDEWLKATVGSVPTSCRRQRATRRFRA